MTMSYKYNRGQDITYSRAGRYEESERKMTPSKEDLERGKIRRRIDDIHDALSIEKLAKWWDDL